MKKTSYIKSAQRTLDIESKDLINIGIKETLYILKNTRDHNL